MILANKISVNGFENQAAARQQDQDEIGSICNAVTLARPVEYGIHTDWTESDICASSNKEHISVR